MPAALVALAITLSGAGCARSPEPGPGAAATTRAPGEVGGAVKSADVIVRMAARVAEARARGTADLAGLSDQLVHVRADGAIEVVVHASAPVGPEQLGELRAEGAEVVDASATPAADDGAAGALVQAWVPAGRLGAVERLAWVAAVTPPAYPPVGG